VGQATEVNFEFTVDGETEVLEITKASPDVVEVIVSLVKNVGGGRELMWCARRRCT
jgi:hypothetical protein